MTRISTLAAILFAFTAGSALGDQARQAEAIRRHIEQTKAARFRTVRAIEARYGALIHRERWSEERLAQERRFLRAEEVQLLALTVDPIQRTQIGEYYGLLIEPLRMQGRLDEATVRRLMEHEARHIARVRAIFGYRIAALERELRALQAQAKNIGKKPAAKHPKPPSKH